MNFPQELKFLVDLAGSAREHIAISLNSLALAPQNKAVLTSRPFLNIMNEALRSLALCCLKASVVQPFKGI